MFFLHSFVIFSISFSVAQRPMGLLVELHKHSSVLFHTVSTDLGNTSGVMPSGSSGHQVKDDKVS